MECWNPKSGAVNPGTLNPEHQFMKPYYWMDSKTRNVDVVAFSPLKK